MNNTYSLDQIQKTGDLNAGLILRQHKLDKMAKIMEIKSNNPRLKRPEITDFLELLSSTIQRYRREINILAPYRITSSMIINDIRKQKTPNMNLDDLKMTSNDLKTTSNEPV